MVSKKDAWIGGKMGEGKKSTHEENSEKAQ
jgi:hypothetical protein